jgi:hypothetical protein
MTTPGQLPRPTDSGSSATPPVDVAAQFNALQIENANLRAQLAAVQQSAPRPERRMFVKRRWLGMAVQVMIVLVSVALGALYVRVSDSDVARGVRDGWQEPAGP